MLPNFNWLRKGKEATLTFHSFPGRRRKTASQTALAQQFALASFSRNLRIDIRPQVE
jgi:hypothetical protein